MDIVGVENFEHKYNQLSEMIAGKISMKNSKNYEIEEL